MPGIGPLCDQETFSYDYIKEKKRAVAEDNVRIMLYKEMVGLTHIIYIFIYIYII